jgi:aryl-alcohol dehydrogenase-like predicted oxidoreductase
VAQLCAELGIAYTPYSPLAGGWLTGKYKRGEPVPDRSRMAMRPEPYEHLRRPETFTALERLAELAKRRGVDSATLAISWLFAQPWVTAVVVGPRRPRHLEPALRALEDPLSRAEADEVAALFE